LTDPALGRLERNVTAGLQAYDELALIPYEPGILGGGQRKMNLNASLSRIEGTKTMAARMTQSKNEVTVIANHIKGRLPQFGLQRMGGYPFPNPPEARASYPAIQPQTDRADGYLRCLAAGMLDFADSDSLPNMDGDPMVPVKGTTGAAAYPTYRGIDSYPLVTEQWQRYRLESGSNGKVRYSISTYMELWNMTNQDIGGSVASVFECNGRFTAGFTVAPVEQALAQYVVSGKPAELPGINGGRWHTAVTLNPPLRPNEYRVVKFADVVMDFPRLPGQTESVKFSGLEDTENDFRSRYRLAYQPPGVQDFQVVDQSMWPVDRNTRTVTTSVRQRFNTTNPGSGYGARPSVFINNIGDPRAAFFISDRQQLVNYPDDSSPGGRNVREANIRAMLYGETRVNLWPDGGHNSPMPPSSPGSENRSPDDPAFRLLGTPGALVERDAQKFVQVISNRGRFFSVTELGHVFDPLMWDPDGLPETNVPTYAQFANIRAAGVSASHRFCGGNTLRIGRPEHDRFRPDFSAFPQAGRPNTRSTSATALLDLFHCGKPTSEVESELIGDLVRIDGQININTASRDALRAALAGRLTMDPQLKLRSQDGVPTTPVELQPPTSQASTASSTPTSTVAHADLLAELIIRNRPYVSAAQLPEKVLMPTGAELSQRPLPREIQVANVRGRVLVEGQPIMGATSRGPDDRSIEPEWNDAAAEEAFGRIFNNATVRSRNFRIVVAGQAVRKTRSGNTKVLATRSRLYHVFIRPIRDLAGNVVRQQTEILYARTL
jgi:hypothetical protein